MRATDLRELVRLGEVDTITATLNSRAAERLSVPEADAHALTIGAPLYWSPAASALVWFVGFSEPDLERVEVDTVPGPAARVARRWKGREVELEGAFELPAIAGRWTQLGLASVIEYSSDKWNSRHQLVGYRHPFGRGVTLAVLGDQSRGVWACQGGRLRITARGIEG